MNRTSRRIGSLAIASLALFVGTDASAADWRLEASEHGVKVYTRPGPGDGFPEFKGITIIKAPVFHILAVLDDIDHACEWTQRCAASRQLIRHSPTHRLFYNRTSVPWPLQDRDAVLEGRVSGMASGKDIVASFRNVRSSRQPPVDGVVRMPILDGAYRVVRLGPRRSRVSLRIRAHPGGVVPDWLASWCAKRIPIDTLNGLRKQGGRTPGRYQAFIERHDPARRPQAPPRAATPTTSRR